jgi:HK97 family phage prohead protease
MPIKLLWQHDSSKPIGVWRDIHEDSKGLFVRGHIIASTQCGFEALELLKAGAIDGLSIGYWIVKSHKSNNGVRYLTEIDLREISLVTFPMLPEARISNYEQPSVKGVLCVVLFILFSSMSLYSTIFVVRF